VDVKVHSEEVVLMDFVICLRLFGRKLPRTVEHWLYKDGFYVAQHEAQVIKILGLGELVQKLPQNDELRVFLQI